MTRFICMAILICLVLTSLAASAQEPSNQAVPKAASIDQQQLQTMENLAKQWLDFLITTQQHGAIPTHATVKPGTSDVVPYTRLVNDDSASGLGHPFLWAYRIWGDQRYLDAAKRQADFFIKAQFPQGGWAQTFRLTPDGGVSPAGRIAHFEEWVQSNGLRHLAAVYHLTGDEKYKLAAIKAGQVILKAQDKAGWWPWGAVVGDKDTRNDYMKGPTLNDWNMNACMGDCLVLYHLTGDRRYLDAIRKAGEWTISAQLSGPTHGWAAQYDLQGNPRWARRMEPPAADHVFGTIGAGTALLMLYDITGEDRYLSPLRKHLAWLRSIPAAKKGWMWYAHRPWTAEENRGRLTANSKKYTKVYGAALPSQDTLDGIPIQTAEPIVAYHFQMVPVDHPQVQSYLKPLNGHYGSRSEKAERWLADELEARSQGPIIPAWRKNIPASRRASARPIHESCAAAYSPKSVAGQFTQLESWRSGKLVRGFVETDGNNHKVNLSRGCGNTTALLRQIALANVALGKANPQIIPVYRRLGVIGEIALVEPTRDWYDITLLEKKGK